MNSLALPGDLKMSAPALPSERRSSQGTANFEMVSTGYIAQWLERLTADQQVPGSNPGVPSFRTARPRRQWPFVAASFCSRDFVSLMWARRPSEQLLRCPGGPVRGLRLGSQASASTPCAPCPRPVLRPSMHRVHASSSPKIPIDGDGTLFGEASKTVWPSGLRRWLQAPVRKGVGSNPTAVTCLCKLSPVGTSMSIISSMRDVMLAEPIGSAPSRRFHFAYASAISLKKWPTPNSAGVSRAGARTRLQLSGHGDMQGFDSSSPALGRGRSLCERCFLKSKCDAKGPPTNFVRWQYSFSLSLLHCLPPHARRGTQEVNIRGAGGVMK
jgi:hypothetical protein